MSVLHSDPTRFRRAGEPPRSIGLRGRVRPLVPLAAVVLGMIGIAGTTFWPPNSGFEVVALTLFVASLVAGTAGLAGDGWSRSALRPAMAVGAVAVVLVQGLQDVGYWRTHVFVVTAAATVLLAVVSLARTAIPTRWAVVLVGMTVVFVAAASGSVLGGDAPDIDVVLLHEQAVAALLEGDNPYTTGTVAVFETIPDGDNELIEEYTYPPVSLAWYALGRAVNGDVRTGGLIALVMAVALGGVLAVGRGRTGDGLVGTVALAGIAVLVANQAMYFMVFNGWTEVTALPFVVLAALWWRRYPVASAVVLGLAFASKQYFVLAAPVLLALPDPWRLRRLVITAASATATLVPFLVWDARGLFDGLVVHHLTRDMRPDSATWAALGIEVPSAITVLVAVAVGVWVGRRAWQPGLAMIAVAVTLSVFTVMAIRGFVNSWWVVYCLAVVGLMALPTDDGGGERAAERRRAAAAPG